MITSTRVGGACRVRASPKWVVGKAACIHFQPHATKWFCCEDSSATL